MNLKQYSLESLSQARHDFELVEEDYFSVHLDCAHMGVGGDDSWTPSVHKEYLVPPDVYRFNLNFHLLNDEISSIEDIYHNLSV